MLSFDSEPLRLDMSMFGRFAIVGVIAFCVDWAIITVLLHIGILFPLARAGSYFCAASAAWILNRKWTFENKNNSIIRQWGAYLIANLSGGMVNYIVSIFISYMISERSEFSTLLSLVCGTLCGMLINFTLSKRYVFKS